MDWEDDPELEEPKFGVWYDIDGNQITFGRWVKLHKVAALEGWDYRRIAYNEVGDYYVSTVLLGAAMNAYDRGAPPLIFETMAFVDELVERDITFLNGQTHHYVINPALEHLQRRYATKEQALRGHAEVCEELRSMIRETLQVTQDTKGIDH